MFTFNDVTFRYRDYIFQDLTLQIPASRIGLVGPNGVGKTTLLRLLAGVLSAQRGAIGTPGEAYLVDFEVGKYKSFTPDDLMLLCSQLKSFDTSNAAAILTALNLGDYRKIPLGELSTGAKKKVSLTMGLISTSPLLLVDEPFESLDGESNARLERYFRRQQRATVIVSHDVPRLEASVDEIYRIEDRGLVKL